MIWFSPVANVNIQDSILAMTKVQDCILAIDITQLNVPHEVSIFTSCNSSCDKAMILQAAVNHSVHRGRDISGTSPFLGWVCPGFGTPTLRTLDQRVPCY